MPPAKFVNELIDVLINIMHLKTPKKDDTNLAAIEISFCRHLWLLKPHFIIHYIIHHSFIFHCLHWPTKHMFCHQNQVSMWHRSKVMGKKMMFTCALVAILDFRQYFFPKNVWVVKILHWILWPFITYASILSVYLCIQV